MRKLLLCSIAVLAMQLSYAQTTLFFDDFEGYTPNEGIAGQSDADPWFVWNVGDPDFDANVVDTIAFSGTQSVVLDQSTTDDIVYLADETALSLGVYTVNFKMYIPTGQEGYFNCMHLWDYESTTNYEWAVDVFFGNGTMTWVVGGQEGGALSFNHDEWFDVSVFIDIDNDNGILLLNGEEAVNFVWSTNNGNGQPGSNTWQTVNFFAYGPSQMNGLYYIDDFTVIQEPASSVDEEMQKLAVWPNPARDLLNLELPETEAQLIRLVGADGRIISEEQNVTLQGIHTMPVSDLAPGNYILQVLTGKRVYVNQIVIN